MSAKDETYYNWAGTGVTKGAFHLKLERWYGKASSYPCEWCGSKEPGKWQRDWSHVKGTDASDLKNYQVLCRKCHMSYDKSPLTAEQVLEVRRILEETNLSQAKIGAMFGCSQMTISRIYRRETWQHI